MAVTVDGKRIDPIQGFNFVLSFEIPRELVSALEEIGISQGGPEIHFQKVSGLEEEVEVAEYREGGFDSLLKAQLPGLVNVTRITLERGISNDMIAMQWLQRVVLIREKDRINAYADAINDGEYYSPRVDMILNIYDRPMAKVKKRIKILQAWPTKITLGDFDAMSSDVVIETLELAHEGFYYI